MRKQQLLAFVLVFPLIALACSLFAIDSSVVDEVATAASFAQGEGTIASVVAATLTAESSPGEVKTPVPSLDAGSPELRVAYVNDGDLWLWTETGGAVELHDAAEAVGEARLSDDGQVVAFTLTDGINPIALWAIQADGSNARLLVDKSGLDALSGEPAALGAAPHRFEFVPGTYTMAFNTRLVFQGPGLALQDDLHLIDTLSVTFSTLLPAGQGGQFYYSPDGSQIAVTTPTSISLVNADGSNRRDAMLTFPSVNTATEAAFYPVARWAKDNTRLRTVISPSEPFAPDANVTVWELLTGGSAPLNLGSYPAFPDALNPASTISPDLTKLVVVRSDGNTASPTFSLHIIDLEDRSDTIYHSGSFIGFTGWARDSLGFVFRQDGDILLGRLGQEVTLLGDVPNVWDVAWPSDGDRVIFVSGMTGGPWELRQRRLAEPSILLTDFTADFPAFSLPGQ